MEAFRSNVVCPNKHLDAEDRLYKGRLLATETYIGGKVEAIESGVFRSDLPCKFTLQPEGYQMLIDRCDETVLGLVGKPQTRWVCIEQASKHFVVVVVDDVNTQ